MHLLFAIGHRRYGESASVSKLQIQSDPSRQAYRVDLLKTGSRPLQQCSGTFAACHEAYTPDVVERRLPDAPGFNVVMLFRALPATVGQQRHVK